MSSLSNSLTELDLGLIAKDQELNEKVILSLTREIAMDIRELPEILANHGISVEEYQRLTQQPRFVAVLREQIIAWTGATNAESRIRVKMQSMVEEALPSLYAELCKDGLTTAKVELVKTLMKGGNVGAEAKGENASDKVSIVINMGAQRVETQQPIVIEHNSEEAA